MSIILFTFYTHTEKDKQNDVVDPVVVQVLPANGGKGKAAANGAAATPTGGEKGGEKSDGDEKEKKEEEDKETNPPVGVISMVSNSALQEHTNNLYLTGTFLDPTLLT